MKTRGLRKRQSRVAVSVEAHGLKTARVTRERESKSSEEFAGVVFVGWLNGGLCGSWTARVDLIFILEIRHPLHRGKKVRENKDEKEGAEFFK